MRAAFQDATYPVPQLRGLTIIPAFPMQKQQWPGVVVSYADTEPVQQISIAHVEYSGLRPFTRWRFQGEMTLTIYSLSDQETDLIFDELLRVIAFSSEHPATLAFRRSIESNDFLGINLQFDQISVGDASESSGTPWGTDELVYESSVTVTVLGDFIADSKNGELLPLSAIQIEATAVPYVTPPAGTYPLGAPVMTQPGEWV